MLTMIQCHTSIMKFFIFACVYCFFFAPRSALFASQSKWNDVGSEIWFHFLVVRASILSKRSKHLEELAQNWISRRTLAEWHQVIPSTQCSQDFMIRSFNTDKVEAEISKLCEAGMVGFQWWNYFYPLSFNPLPKETHDNNLKPFIGNLKLFLMQLQILKSLRSKSGLIIWDANVLSCANRLVL